MNDPKKLHIDGALTKISVAYRNGAYIWREVLPVVPVTKLSDKYYVMDRDEAFRVVNDSLAASALPNEISMTQSTDNFSCASHGLAGWVPQESVDNADQPLRPLASKAKRLTDLLDLAQERRVRDLVFNAASYPVGNKVQLSGAAQWSDPTSDPIKDIRAAIMACFIKANTLVFGAETMDILQQHPKILDAVKGSTRVQAANGGIASNEEIRNLFGVDKVLVGESKINSSAKGVAASHDWTWGKHMAALYVDPSPDIETISFGWTFSESDKKVFADFDGKRGEKGSHYRKVAWNSDQKIVAGDVGYFIEDAIL